MARLSRVAIPGRPHHVTQRGNRRMQTFFSDADYRAYVSLLASQCGQWDVRIWAYCLMPNHVHLVLVPGTEEALGRALGEAHRRYTWAVNRREGWRGFLWQGRFSSFVMDTAYLLAATAYIERNPVAAGLVERAEQWPFSSARAHARGAPDGVAEVGWLTEETAGWVCSWGEHLRREPDKDFGKRLRCCETTGRPLGDKPFVEKLSALVGRCLLPSKRGPKPAKEKRGLKSKG